MLVSTQASVHQHHPFKTVMVRMMMSQTMSTSGLHFLKNPWKPKPTQAIHSRNTAIRAASVRSLNRKPLQKGRNLSIEAIQTIQALKLAYKNDKSLLDQVFHSKFNRLLKFDMTAVLRELLRQNHCLLALKVFEDIREEHWYKPQVLLYNEMIAVMATNGFIEEVQLLFRYLESEISGDLPFKTDDFNQLLATLISFKLSTGLVMECYESMKSAGCEPDRSTFKLLVHSLESIGEFEVSGIVRQDAYKCYGESLDFEAEEEEIAT
ncbi:unnamed protein product [Dovyalis caffra]|uniref:Pentatricopeptide repeat-containing protein n=1 Tax=Dovyalis caffra TaxID=77055 RepID=A0AAV1R7Q0_9ROSI|nr:unnamed protein product [Dovyalis caffra]